MFLDDMTLGIRVLLEYHCCTDVATSSSPEQKFHAVHGIPCQEWLIHVDGILSYKEAGGSFP
nr:hypothetical protein Iba_chr14cCG12720 [Ipomoea batatas]